MFDGEAVESTIVNGVEVLLALLEIRRPAPQGGGFYPYSTEQVDVSVLITATNMTVWYCRIKHLIRQIYTGSKLFCRPL